jgi:hypothetical protein
MLTLTCAPCPSVVHATEALAQISGDDVHVETPGRAMKVHQTPQSGGADVRSLKYHGEAARTSFFSYYHELDKDRKRHTKDEVSGCECVHSRRGVTLRGVCVGQVQATKPYEFKLKLGTEEAAPSESSVKSEGSLLDDTITNLAPGAPTSILRTACSGCLPDTLIRR